jgi:hypothetical protein
MRCSTAARSRRASRPATVTNCSSTRTWAWSRRSSTSRSLAVLTGHLAIGHCRYSTTGGSTWENAQPTLGGHRHDDGRLAHNGNLINSAELRELVIAAGTAGLDGTRRAAPRQHHRHRPGHGAAGRRPDRSLEERALEVLPLLRGAFCFVFMDEHTLYAARDPQGIRPLVLGRLDRGWVVASETAALDIVGAAVIREIEPGELIVIDENGLRSHRFAEPSPRAASSSTSTSPARHHHRGRVVHEARVEMGPTLAREHPVEADLVIPVPESGTPAAIGYAQESGIPFGQGLVKNAYVGRTFIQPPDHAPARHPAQAQPAARGHQGQAPRRRRRLDRARQHPAGPCGCCARPARPRCTCASPRRRCAGRASTASTSRPAPSSSPPASGSRRSALDRRRHPGLHQRGRHDRRDRPARERLCTACFTGPSYPVELPRRGPTSSARQGWRTSSRSSCSSPRP